MSYALRIDAIVPRHGSSVRIVGVTSIANEEKYYEMQLLNTGLPTSGKPLLVIKSSGGIATLRMALGPVGGVGSVATNPAFWTDAGTIADAEWRPKTTVRIPYGYYTAVSATLYQSFFEINPDGSLVFNRSDPVFYFPAYVDTIVASYSLL